MKINVIVALDEQNGFSKNGEIPWINEPSAKEDLKHFKKLTMDSICIMGRNTYEDIAKFTGQTDILPGRDCMVLSRDKSYFISNETLVFSSMKYAIEHAKSEDKNVFIIGGASLFEEALRWKLDTLYITKFKGDYGCDLFFPYEYVKKTYKCDLIWTSLSHTNITYYRYINKND